MRTTRYFFVAKVALFDCVVNSILDHLVRHQLLFNLFKDILAPLVTSIVSLEPAPVYDLVGPVLHSVIIFREEASDCGG